MSLLFLGASASVETKVGAGIGSTTGGTIGGTSGVVGIGGNWGSVGVEGFTSGAGVIGVVSGDVGGGVAADDSGVGVSGVDVASSWGGFFGSAIIIKSEGEAWVLVLTGSAGVPLGASRGRASFESRASVLSSGGLFCGSIH